MPCNEDLADRIRHLLNSKKIKSTEKKMFGGVCFLVDDKMLIGVEKERLSATPCIWSANLQSFLRSSSSAIRNYCWVMLIASFQISKSSKRNLAINST